MSRPRFRGLDPSCPHVRGADSPDQQCMNSVFSTVNTMTDDGICCLHTVVQFTLLFCHYSYTVHYSCDFCWFARWGHNMHCFTHGRVGPGPWVRTRHMSSVGESVVPFFVLISVGGLDLLFRAQTISFKPKTLGPTPLFSGVLVGVEWVRNPLIFPEVTLVFIGFFCFSFKIKLSSFIFLWSV